jgi:hypothetical protein
MQIEFTVSDPAIYGSVAGMLTMIVPVMAAATIGAIMQNIVSLGGEAFASLLLKKLTLGLAVSLPFGALIGGIVGRASGEWWLAIPAVIAFVFVCLVATEVAMRRR